MIMQSRRIPAVAGVTSVRLWQSVRSATLEPFHGRKCQWQCPPNGMSNALADESFKLTFRIFEIWNGSSINCRLRCPFRLLARPPFPQVGVANNVCPYKIPDVSPNGSMSRFFFFVLLFFFFFQIPPSLNMLRIQAGEQEFSEKYLCSFRVQCNMS